MKIQSCATCVELSQKIPTDNQTLDEQEYPKGTRDLLKVRRVEQINFARTK